MEKEKIFIILKNKNIYLCIGIGACLILLYVILMFKGIDKELKPIEVYELNSQGDYVGDNFKIEYNDKNDIVLMESGNISEKFKYYYNEDDSVYRIDISSSSEKLPNTRVDIIYYDNGEIFVLIEHVVFKQYGHIILESKTTTITKAKSTTTKKTTGGNSPKTGVDGVGAAFAVLAIAAAAAFAARSRKNDDQ